MRRKNSAVDLTDLAIGILVLGIVVGIGSRILLSMRDNRLSDLNTLTTNNETTYINSSSGELSNTWGSGVSECISNYTGSGSATSSANTTIPSSNYSANIADVDGVISLTNSTGKVYPDAACTYNYYDTSSPQWSLPNDAASGVGEYGNWFDVIVIVGIAGLILALILSAFGRAGSEVEGASY